MERLAHLLFAAAVLALPAAATAQEQRDWLITGQPVPRAPDLISRNLTPPPLDLATTQTAPGQWLRLPPTPRQVPQAELDQLSSGLAPGAPNGPQPLVPAMPYLPYLPGMAKPDG